MYVDEAGRWQNRIDTLWIRINDIEKRSLARSPTLLNVVATAVSGVFDAVFGKKLFSVQLFGVSTALSIGGMNSAWALFSYEYAGITHERNAYSYAIRFMVFAGCCFALAVIPAVFRSPVTIGFSLLPVIVVLSRVQDVVMSAVLVVGLLSDILLLAFVRFMSRKAITQPTSLKILLILLLQLGLAALLVLLPTKGALYAVSGHGYVESDALPGALLLIAISNFFTALASCAFAAALVFVLLHRITWPFLGRIFYPLARFRLMTNRVLLLGIRGACMTYAVPLFSHGAQDVLMWFIKNLR
jgi:hypothetical protein